MAEAGRRAKPGDDPRGFVEAHVRRLEALRRAGIVEREEAGVWRVPPDFLDRAAAHEGTKGSGVSITLRSHLGLEEQVRATGATWLDRNLVGGEPAPAASGFGAEVRSALAARQDVLIEDGLATRRAQRVVLANNLLSTLRDREVSKTAQAISAETGLGYRAVKDGDSVSGIYRRSVQLASGQFAMVGDGVGFSWYPGNRSSNRAWARPSRASCEALPFHGTCRVSGGSASEQSSKLATAGWLRTSPPPTGSSMATTGRERSGRFRASSEASCR